MASLYLVLSVLDCACAFSAGRRKLLAAFYFARMRFLYRRRIGCAFSPERALRILAAFAALGAVSADAHAQAAHFSGAEMTLGSGIKAPNGICTDALGNIYIADSGNERVLKETLTANGYVQSVVTASPAVGRVDDIAVDAAGNLYFADYGWNRVEKAVPSGGAYTLSVLPTGTLQNPSGIAVDASSNLYIADSGNGRVLKETFTGSGYSESAIVSSGLSWPVGIQVDASGNVFIADTYNNRVLEEAASPSGYKQTAVLSTGLSQPVRFALDAAGDLYIADNGSNQIVKESFSAGTYSPSVMATLPLNNPVGVALDADGNVYIADSSDSRVLLHSMSGAQFGSSATGSVGSTASLLFTFDKGGILGAPLVSTQGAAGLDYAAAGSSSCAQGASYAAGAVCFVNVTFHPLLAGFRYGAGALLDSSGNVLATGYLAGSGAGPQVSFSPGVQSIVADGLLNPRAVTVDAAGNVYIADTDHQLVLKEAVSGGAPSQLNQSSLQWPCAVAVDGAGNLYISDTFHSRILKETLQGGTYTESTAVSSGLDYAFGLAVDWSGNLYVANAGNSQILKEVPTSSGYVAQQLPFQGFSNVQGLAVDGSGDVYVADAGNNRIVKETLSGGTFTQTTVQTSSALSNPKDVAVDASGSIYIADTNNNRVLKETFSGGNYVENTLGTGLAEVDSISVDAHGNVYVADTGDGRIIKLDFADAPSLSFPDTPVGATSSGKTATLSNIGNMPLSFPVQSSGSNPAVSPNFTLDSDVPNACPQITASEAASANLLPGASCSLALGFAPTTAGAVQGNLVVSDTSLNNAGSLQSLTLSGHGVNASANLQLSVPSVATYGNPIQVTASMTDSATQSPVTGGTIAFADANGSFGSQAVKNGTAQASWLAPAAGTFILNANFTSPNNSMSNASAQTTVQITAAPLLVSATNASKTYGGSNPQFTGAITGAVNNDSFEEAFQTSAGAASPVGSYNIVPSASGANLASYLQKVQNGTLQISSASLTLSADDATRAYGAANPAFTGTVSGAVNNDQLTETFSTTATSKSSVASYPITPAVSGAAAGNYNPTIKAGSLTITQAGLLIAANDATRTYGAANPTFTGTLNGAVNGDQLAETFTTTATANSPVASYAITPAISGAATINYNPIIKPGSLTITQANLSVAADDTTRQYGAANPTFTGTISGAVNGDQLTETFSTTASSNSSVASYPITPAVSGAAAANYHPTIKPGSLTITQASLSLSADNLTRVYGAANPTLTGTMTGAMIGDQLTETFTTDATTASPAAAYPITPAVSGAVAANYKPAIKLGVLTITKANLALAANDQTRRYGAANPTFSGTVTGAVNGDQFTEAFSTSATQTSPVASYPIVPSVSGANLSNYSQAATSGTLTIIGAPLNVSANSVSRGYGMPDPEFTGSVTGILEGDTLQESFSTDATQASAPGAYSITPAVTGAALSNYTPSMAKGVLTITAAPLTVSAQDAVRPYGSPNPQFAGIVSGAVPGEAFTETFTTSATAQSPVGVYPITPAAAGPTAANYTPSVQTGRLTVTPAALAVTAAPATRFYGAPNPCPHRDDQWCSKRRHTNSDVRNSSRRWRCTGPVPHHPYRDRLRACQLYADREQQHADDPESRIYHNTHAANRVCGRDPVAGAGSCQYERNAGRHRTVLRRQSAAWGVAVASRHCKPLHHTAHSGYLGCGVGRLPG